MLSQLNVSEIQIWPVKPNDGLLAFASLVIGNALYLSSIGVYRKRNGEGYRITYPTRKVGGRDLQIFHPIHSEVGRMIEKAITEKASEVLEI